MGTLVRLVVESGDAERAAVAMEAAFGRLRELDGLLSNYKADSELSQLCRAGEMQVGPDLLYVLEKSQRLAVASGGAFDVTIGDRSRLSTYRDISIASSTRTVTLRRAGMRLDLGGIAKGYAGDQLLQVLREHGCPRALAAVSGDLVMGAGPVACEIRGLQRYKNGAKLRSFDIGRHGSETHSGCPDGGVRAGCLAGLRHG